MKSLGLTFIVNAITMLIIAKARRAQTPPVLQGQEGMAFRMWNQHYDRKVKRKSDFPERISSDL